MDQFMCFVILVIFLWNIFHTSGGNQKLNTLGIWLVGVLWKLVYFITNEWISWYSL